MKNLPTTYSPAEIEQKWYAFWLRERLFCSKPNDKKPYSIVMPPPNVTGVLHMGHMLNNTIQDTLVRRARMLGYNACWVPGTDHASIATEAKVTAKLASEGIDKNSISRDEFLQHAWAWTQKHGGIILEQLKRLGASCDWERTDFTMNDDYSLSVVRAFVDLYRSGLIYRGARMINWDPKAQTAISDEEVVYKQQPSKLYYLKYLIVDAPSMNCSINNVTNDSFYITNGENNVTNDPFYRTNDVKSITNDLLNQTNDVNKVTNDLLNQTNDVNKVTNDLLNQTNDINKIANNILNQINDANNVTNEQFCIVATTRPETIMGDTAVAINPSSERTAHLRGKYVVVPLVGRIVPIIEDDYVDADFGTGCLKVTPAHDINDYVLGQRHNLRSIDIFNDNGTMSAAAGLYIGMERFAVRAQIEKDLANAGLLEKVEPYINNVGFSERTDVPIEPKLSTQWFVSMKEISKPALDAVMNDEVRLFPAKFKNTYRHWMENIRDWCISRQLWWGHRVPAWYDGDGNIYVAEDAHDALRLARQTNSALNADDLVQDEDCLDTWFSSWLWPISVFDKNAAGDAKSVFNGDLRYYYPTVDLVTAPEILFFWVARMIIAGCRWGGGVPFRNVYLTGIVRDHLGRKMSKSLGNSPDPIALIDKYGADGVRLGMLLTSAAGNDLPFDEALCEQGRNFCNKIWNSFRLIKGWEEKMESGNPLMC